MKHGLGACPLCHSTEYIKAGGVVTCRNGHEPLDYREERDEVEYRQGLGVKIKRRRRKRVAKRPVEKRVRREERARNNLVLSMLQEVLKAQTKQVQAIVGAGPELEAMVKEMWLYYVTWLENVEHNITLQGEEDDTLLDEIRDPRVPGLKTYHRVKLWLRLRSLVGILYSSCCYLRIPVIARDLSEWIFQGRLTYINAYLALSETQLARLVSAKYCENLENFKGKGVPSPEVIDDFYHHLARALGTEFGVCFPPFNVTGLVFRFVSALHLPIHFYHVALKLVEFSMVDLAVDERKHHPVALVLGFVVVAVKLLLGVNRRSGDATRSGFFEQFMPSFEQIKQTWTDRGLLGDSALPWDATIPKQMTREELDAYLRFSKESIVRFKTQGKEPQHIRQYLDTSLDLFQHVSGSSMESRLVSPDLATVYSDEAYTTLYINRRFSSKRYVVYDPYSEYNRSVHPEYKMLLMAATRAAGWTRMSVVQRTVRFIEGRLMEVCQNEVDSGLY